MLLTELCMNRTGPVIFLMHNGWEPEILWSGKWFPFNSKMRVRAEKRVTSWWIHVDCLKRSDGPGAWRVDKEIFISVSGLRIFFFFFSLVYLLTFWQHVAEWENRRAHGKRSPCFGCMQLHAALLGRWQQGNGFVALQSQCRKGFEMLKPASTWPCCPWDSTGSQEHKEATWQEMQTYAKKKLYYKIKTITWKDNLLWNS